MFKPVLAPILAVAATAVLAVSAMAAGATGPQHLSLSGHQCYDKGPYTICVDSTGEATQVLTPSGNFSADVNLTESLTISSNGTLLSSGASNLHEHELYTGNFAVLQEAGIHDVSTMTVGGSTCTVTDDLHVTQIDPISGTGHIQYEKFSFVCV